MIAYDRLNDDELLTLLKKDDAKAFTEVYNRYKWLLHGHAYRWLADREEAKDVVHELFAHLWSKRKDLAITSSFSGYLYACLRNSILKKIAHGKVQARYMASLQEFVDQGIYLTDQQVRERELQRRIEAELELLPPKMRRVFEMSRKDDLRYAEIAQELNISEQTVRKHIQHALRILKIKLGLLIIYFLFV